MSNQLPLPKHRINMQGTRSERTREEERVRERERTSAREREGGGERVCVPSSQISGLLIDMFSPNHPECRYLRLEYSHDRLLFPALVSFRQMDRQAQEKSQSLRRLPQEIMCGARTRQRPWPALHRPEDSHKDRTVAVISSDESRLYVPRSLAGLIIA